MSSAAPEAVTLAVIGAGPSGLMAAEAARTAGIEVDVFEAMPSPGRRFLVAGKGGLNLTHGEARPAFDARYRERARDVAAWLDDFDADALRTWARDLGIDTRIGSSGRVFPLDGRAAPLLRAWLARLRSCGVRLHVRHRWLGWDAEGRLRFATADGERRLHAAATVLALGGASWPRIGGNDAWVTALADAGIEVAALQPANCGFEIAWSPLLVERHAGAPLKPVIACWHDADGKLQSRQGECVISRYGIEGSLVYAAAADLRTQIQRQGHATLWLDLAPGRDVQRLQADLSKPRGKRSLGEHLRRQAGLDAAKTALVFEQLGRAAGDDLQRLAATIKRLPLDLQRCRPLAEAISSAGGVRLEELDDGLMLRQRAGVFCAGEMLDWEAPTGGYLLQASFASGLRAGRAAAAWLQRGGEAERGT
ncbi:TIGR03862 family flavoprotein [Luteimonas sp. e5]